MKILPRNREEEWYRAFLKEMEIFWWIKSDYLTWDKVKYYYEYGSNPNVAAIKCAAAYYMKRI